MHINTVAMYCTYGIYISCYDKRVSSICEYKKSDVFNISKTIHTHTHTYIYIYIYIYIAFLCSM